MHLVQGKCIGAISRKQPLLSLQDKNGINVLGRDIFCGLPDIEAQSLHARQLFWSFRILSSLSP